MNGYAATPGTGPNGKQCADCGHLTAHKPNKRRYYKCGLMVPTHGPGTDIKISARACLRFEERNDA